MGGLIVSPEQNQQQQERGGRQQREKGQRRRQNISRIFSNGYVEDDPADTEQHQHVPENQLISGGANE